MDRIGLIPIPENKDIFQLRQSCRDSIDRKLDSINSIQTNLRSSNRGAFTRSNMALFSGIGINQKQKNQRNRLCLKRSQTPNKTMGMLSHCPMVNIEELSKRRLCSILKNSTPKRNPNTRIKN